MKNLICFVMVITICPILFGAFTQGGHTSTNQQVQKDYTFSVRANKQQLKLINELKDKDISLLEFSETVFPDVAAKFTDSQRKRYAALLHKIQDTSYSEVDDTYYYPTKGYKYKTAGDFLLQRMAKLRLEEQPPVILRRNDIAVN